MTYLDPDPRYVPEDTACDDCERTHPWRDHGPLDEPPPPLPDTPRFPRLTLVILALLLAVTLGIAWSVWR